ncbi:MAG TPA: acyltransferase family protein [Rhizomicrobium sp.]|nr:acyltransferase family protein [Rhizomicrobium sp.]
MVRGHRNDIDGLRAVAILPVLFYHASIWPFSGGYVGVDVFFVISGYLITGLILREQVGTGFSLANFYDRRIRRILPALFAVLLAATIAALFILLPDELETYGKSLLGAVFFYANILFWQRDLDYFAADAAQNPLLHVWSLSVEEQFYLLWPLLLIALARRRRALPWAIGAIAAASLGLSFAFARSDPSATFYLLPMRAWQLLFGAILATGGLPAPRSAITRHAVAVGGFACVATAALVPSGGPLYHSLGAVLGTAAILFAADGGDNVISALLATRVPVFIGRISYSLYLWHWPALVFVRLYLNRALNLGESLAVLAAAFAAAALSWRFIEQPIRARRGAAISFRGAALGAAAFAAVAVVLLAAQGLPSRVPPDVRTVDAEGTAPLEGRWCGPSDNCVSGSRALAGEAVLWGDSHARALAPGLDAFAAARHLRLRIFTRSACPPLPGLDVVSPGGAGYPRCAAFDRTALAAILASKTVRLVILEARWEIYFNDARIRPKAGAEPAFSSALGHLLDTLNARGIPVLVVGNVPRFDDFPAHCYGRERLFGRDPTPCESQSVVDGLRPILKSEKLIFAAVSPHDRFDRFYSPFTDLCDGAGCHAFSAGLVLYLDEHHLSAAGARLIGQAADRKLQGWPP